MRKHVHMVIPGLFLPREIAAEACAGLRLPALGKILARAQPSPLSVPSLEEWLCAAFGAGNQAIAPVTLQADGEPPGTAYWLRADPVHLMLRGDQLILRPIMALDADEAGQLCDSLNRHFADDGLHFAAPQPNRWHLRLAGEPGITTHPLAQVAGKDIHPHLPQGENALHWHKLLNEIQMLLFEHPVNQAREARGEWLINSVWPWGGGYAPEKLLRPCEKMYTDSPLAAAFAKAAGIVHASLPEKVSPGLLGITGATLILWDGLHHALRHGDLGEWRDSAQAFEQTCASPLLRALRAGKIEKITLDLLQAQASQRYTLTRGMAWHFWRLPKRLDAYALV